MCDPAGTEAARLAPQGSPGSVPLAYVAGLCTGAAALGSALSLLVHLKTHKIEGSCKFTAMCPGNCLVLPCWHSPGPFPRALPMGARSEWSLTSLDWGGGVVSKPGTPGKPDCDIAPRRRNPLKAGRQAGAAHAFQGQAVVQHRAVKARSKS